MAGEEAVQDVAAESSTATEPTESTSQATIQPGSPNGQPAQQTVPYDRFQQVIRQVQEYRPLVAQVPQLQQALKEANEKLAAVEKRASQGAGPSPEEAEQLRQAATALERIMLSNPEVLERVLSAHPKFKLLSDNADRLMATQGGVTQMQQAQSQALYRSAQSHIYGLAKEAGLPQTPEYLQRLVRLVAAEAQQLEGGNQRFSQGDLSVLDEAFTALQGNFLAHTQRAGTADLLKTKSRTQSLPPAPRGGAAGPPGLSKFDPTKPNAVRDRLSELSKAAGAMLAEGGKE